MSSSLGLQPDGFSTWTAGIGLASFYNHVSQFFKIRDLPISQAPWPSEEGASAPPIFLDLPGAPPSPTPPPLHFPSLPQFRHHPNSSLLTPAVFSLSEVSAPFFQKLSSLLPSSLLPSLHPFLPPFFLPFLLLSLTILQRSQGVRKGGNTSHSFSSSCQND